MEKILFLEFYEDATLKEIYEELIFYHQNRQLAETTYKGITLSNIDIDKLKDTVTRLELELSEEEYEQYKKNEQQQHNQFQLYCARTSTPYIVRYWITKISNVIKPSKREEWEMYCYDLIKSAYVKDDIQNETLKAYYNIIVSTSKIIMEILKCNDYYNYHDLENIQKVIDQEFSNITYDFEMNHKFLFVESAVSKFTNFSSRYKELTHYDQVMDNKKYSNLSENKITKKRIPDYLRFKH